MGVPCQFVIDGDAQVFCIGGWLYEAVVCGICVYGGFFFLLDIRVVDIYLYEIALTMFHPKYQVI